MRIDYGKMLLFFFSAVVVVFVLLNGSTHAYDQFNVCGITLDNNHSEQSDKYPSIHLE